MMSTQKGFGLSEILIGLFLSSLILLSLTQLYLNNKHQYVITQKLLKARFDLQWVNDMLADSLRRAGFTPCLGLNHLKTADRRRNDGNLPSLIMTPQFIQVNRMSEYFLQLLAKPKANQLLLAGNFKIDKNRPLVIADCYHAEVQNIQNINKQQGNLLVTLSKPLKFEYEEDAYAGSLLEEKWFIKKNPEGLDALFYQLVGQAEELSPYIHSLQMQAVDKQLISVLLGLDNKIHQLIVSPRGGL